MNAITHIAIQRPELIRVATNVETDWSPEVSYAYHMLFTFPHVFHMRQRKVLSDKEFTGWLRWMKSSFAHGTIGEIWKSNIEMGKWFDPAFQQFVDKELTTATAKILS